MRAKTITVLFTVTSRNAFPIDMLRYDHCVPASETDANVIQNSISKIGRDEGPAVVQLRAQIEGVQVCGGRYPTAGRWESFGWKLVATEMLP